MDEKKNYNSLVSVRVVPNNECVLIIVFSTTVGVRMDVVPSHGIRNWRKRCRTESKYSRCSTASNILCMGQVSALMLMWRYSCGMLSGFQLFLRYMAFMLYVTGSPCFIPARNSVIWITVGGGNYFSWGRMDHRLDRTWGRRR